MILKIGPPAARNMRSFLNWVSDEKPLFRKENRFLENGEDFIALADLREFSWLDRTIGRLLDWCLPRNVRSLLDPSKHLSPNCRLTVA